MFCKILYIFTVTFDQLNESMNKRFFLLNF